MRSTQIHRAMDHGASRYHICRMVSMGVRKLHKPGTHLPGSIGDVLAFVAKAGKMPELPRVQDAADPVSFTGEVW